MDTRQICTMCIFHGVYCYSLRLLLWKQGPSMFTPNMICYDVMWCDVMWCYDVMWCDMVWCGVVWCGVMLCDVIWYDMTFIPPFIQAQVKENIKAPRHWPLCGKFACDRWIPRTKASNAENVTIWWCHHERFLVFYEYMSHQNYEGIVDIENAYFI